MSMAVNFHRRGLPCPRRNEQSSSTNQKLQVCLYIYELNADNVTSSRTKANDNTTEGTAALIPLTKGRQHRTKTTTSRAHDKHVTGLTFRSPPSRSCVYSFEMEGCLGSEKTVWLQPVHEFQPQTKLKSHRFGFRGKGSNTTLTRNAHAAARTHVPKSERSPRRRRRLAQQLTARRKRTQTFPSRKASGAAQPPRHAVARFVGAPPQPRSWCVAGTIGGKAGPCLRAGGGMSRHSPHRSANFLNSSQNRKV